MSNRSSCRVLRTLGMDGFLGFKCGPSCSEKQHNKEIKALIDAIDDLLAYDLETKKELGAQDLPGFSVLLSKLDDINNKAGRLLGKHEPDYTRSFQPRGYLKCEQAVEGIRATVDSIRGRVFQADDPRLRGLLDEKKRRTLTSNRGELWVTHGNWSQNGSRLIIE